MLWLRVVATALALVGLTNLAQATPVNATTGELRFFQGGTNAEGLAHFDRSSRIVGSFSRTLSGLPSNISGTADLTFTAAGDFGAVAENVSLSVDGKSLGTFLNSDPTDDAFDNASFGDVGSPAAIFGKRSATASNVDLGNALSDGELEFQYTFNWAFHGWYQFIDIDNLPGTDFVRTDIAYETTSPSRVPVPGTIALLGAGLIGLGVAARRSQTV